MLLLVVSIKLVAEIALLAFAGRWLLGWLAGPKRQGNVFYQTLELLTRPFVRVVRAITPAVVIDRHIPLAAVALLALAWVVATMTKIDLCVRAGVQSCL
jgi:uncharacterized protein YggT (Ycf19 family)